MGDFTIILKDSSYFYVFDLEIFRDRLYAFLSSKSDYLNSNASIRILSGDKKSFNEISKIKFDDNDMFIRNTFNDDNKQIFLATSARSESGAIYVSKDMKNFKKVYSSDKFGFRSINKFKGTYLAGTDSGGFLVGSKDGENWNIVAQSKLFGQINEIIYFIDNGSISTTDDLKTFKQVFTPPTDNAQMYAVYQDKKRLYIGTGWKWNGDNLGKGNIFYTEDGENFTHVAEISESPMIYFIAPSSIKEGDLIFGGYASGNIFHLGVETGLYNVAFSVPVESLYTAKIFEGDVYIGSYGKAQVIRYQPVTD